MNTADALAIQTYEQCTRVRKDEGLTAISELITHGASPSEIYAKCVSIHQSRNSTNGAILEKIVEEALTRHGIPFLRQVSDQNGIISTKKRGSVHDIIIDAKLGDNIKNKIVLSCKTSLRERYKQDGHLIAKEVYMITFDDPKTLTKYENGGITIVTIGKDDAFEKLLKALAARYAKPLVTDTLESCSQPSSCVGGEGRPPMTTTLDQTPEVLNNHLVEDDTRHPS